MTGRLGFLGGSRVADPPERDVEETPGSGRASGDPLIVRLGDSNERRSGVGFGGTPDVDPVWGTPGAVVSFGVDNRFGRSEVEASEPVSNVEILGDGFQISGQVQTGQFARLSDWLNMQPGFIQLREALHVHLGQSAAPDPGLRRDTLWVRLSQVVLVAERRPVQQKPPGTPVIAKEQHRVSMVTPGYSLRGTIHVHADGSMAQFLESADTCFLPITDVTVHWLSDAALVARFPFAVVNRDQVVTILDEGASTSDEEGELVAVPIHDDEAAV